MLDPVESPAFGYKRKKKKTIHVSFSDTNISYQSRIFLEPVPQFFG